MGIIDQLNHAVTTAAVTNEDITTKNVTTAAGTTLNTLQFNIVQFTQILRQLGIRISSAEVLDALRGLSEVNLLHKNEMKTALQATLIKSSREKVVFEKAFDLFFVTPEEKQQRLKERQQLQAEKNLQLREAEEELTWSDSRWQDDSNQTEEIQLQLTEEQIETYTKLPEQAKEQIRKMLEQASGNLVNNPQELIQRTVQGALNYWKYYLAKQEQELEQSHSHQLGAELTGTDELDSVIEGVRDSYFGLDEEIHYQDIQKIADQDFDKAGLIIRKLTRSLATRISRRYRQSKKKQKLDIRRTIRKNIKYGGTLLELKYKTKRIHKPELLLLCDVSASMARYAGFILHFVYGLSSVVDNIESFVFSEDLDRITSAFEQDQSFATTMADIMNQSRELGRGTDLNLALTKLLKNHGQLLTKKRIIIIVSDTKTLAPDKAASQLADIQARVREIIWLNTLPKRDWKSSKAIDLFRNNCVMFECYTLAHLEKVIHNKLSF